MSSEQNASNPISENLPHLSSAPASSAEPQQETQSDKDNHGLNPLERAKLFEAAVGAKEVSYCPYSSFRVGAALLTSPPSSKIIIGANVENASTPVGICAERCMLAKAITEGHKNFRAIAVASNISPPASPCGMCRQFIREFCAKTTPIFMVDREGNYAVRTLDELLPLSFGPEDLERGDGGGERPGV